MMPDDVVSINWDRPAFANIANQLCARLIHLGRPVVGKLSLVFYSDGPQVWIQAGL